MTEQERHESSVSRRTMLKRIGIAGAVAWVTPVVTSMNTPAFAASLPTSPCDNPGICGQFAPCGAVQCFCFPKADGHGFCGQTALCDSLVTCDTGSCPPGFTCAVNTCCGIPVCVAPCGPGLRTRAPIAADQRGGLTVAGQS